MMKNYIRLLLTLSFVAAISGAASAATFTFTGSALSGAFTSIPIRANSPGGNSIGTGSAVVWDPTSAPSGQFPNGRIYFTNREQSTAPAVGGLYSVDASTGVVTFLGLQSSATGTGANPSFASTLPRLRSPRLKCWATTEQQRLTTTRSASVTSPARTR